MPEEVKWDADELEAMEQAADAATDGDSAEGTPGGGKKSGRPPVATDQRDGRAD